MNISRDRFMCSNREHMCALDNAKQFIALGTTALDRFIGIFSHLYASVRLWYGLYDSSI